MLSTDVVILRIYISIKTCLYDFKAWIDLFIFFVVLPEFDPT